MSSQSVHDRREVVVTLHVWGVPTRRVPQALWRMAWDRWTLRRMPGLTFAKLLGTGRGSTFTPRDADPRHWALLACWTDGEAAQRFEYSPVARAWLRISNETCRFDLVPIASRGRWSGYEPFGEPAGNHDGVVAAITRARLVPRKAMTFWRAVPPVVHDLHRSPGLLLSFGIGEAPIGLQGTFSVWESESALRNYAYAGAHRDAIRRTATEGWYAEELFARFVVRHVGGTYLGRRVGLSGA
jgi:hypothetical protein